jgi:NAD(P)-dependent dehydrogenase (short-subunit alcohol dehydrogenase family)
MELTAASRDSVPLNRLLTPAFFHSDRRPTRPSTRHPATPEEIADAIVYLASDNAGFVHGVVLPVVGGRAAV